MSTAAVPFEELVRVRDFPCVGARAAVRRDSLTISRYEDVFAEVTDAALDLTEFVRHHCEPPSSFAAFAMIDEAARCGSEAEFELYLWDVLRAIHNHDSEPWDPRFSRDPRMSTFKYSFAGHAMFVIGLHPHASRRARRSREHVIVFNPVWQFDLLREDNRLDDFVDVVRKRDVVWDSVINPNLSFEGTHSDALQYSGREVDAAWRCPYSRW